MKIRFYRDADPADTGGGLGPSLSDIDRDASNGNGNEPTPPVEGVNADGSLQEGFIKQDDGTIVKKNVELPTPPSTDPVEGVNEDGSLQDGYEKDVEGKVVKKQSNTEDDNNDSDDNEPAPDDAKAYWETVEKITGRTLQVEYPEGIDLLSPEATALRENAAREDEILQFEEHLKKTFPRQYAFFLHAQSGKPEEEFFKGSSGNGYLLPEKESLSEDADAQAALYRYSLTSKGIDAEEADALVSAAIKANKLKEKSIAAYGTIESAQAQAVEDAKRVNKQIKDQFDAAVDNLDKQITNTVEKEIAFIVPETKKPEFKQFVMDNITHQDGKFYFVQELQQDKLKLQVEALLFQWNKGDLNTVIKKAAKTQAVQRLRMNIDKDKAALKTGGNNGGGSNGYVPLGNI